MTIYNSDWSASVGWAASKKNEILYAGYRFDPETGLYLARNRMYHPTLGRWLQRDLIGGYVDGMNLYEYCMGAPIGGLDPNGTVLVAFRGWDASNSLVAKAEIWSKVGSIRSEIIDAVVAQQASIQAAKAFEANELDKAFNWVLKTAGAKFKGTRCLEPVYIVGYSIGSRTALVLAKRLNAYLAKSRYMVDAFYVRRIQFFDYNWGAHTTDPYSGANKGFGSIDKPMYATYDHKLPKGVLVVHDYSDGWLMDQKDNSRRRIRNHTQAVYEDWADLMKKGKAKDGSSHVLGFFARWGAYLLANTTGKFARTKFGWRTGGIGWDVDHIALGRNEAVGALRGKQLAKDYPRAIIRVEEQKGHLP